MCKRTVKKQVPLAAHECAAESWRPGAAHPTALRFEAKGEACQGLQPQGAAAQGAQEENW